MSLKYLIDENVNPIYARQLRRREADLVIRVVGEPNTPFYGTLDPEILIWCEKNQYVLVTNNRRSMPIHLKEHIAQNRHIPGIFILNPNLSVGDNLNELILIAQGSFADDYLDQIIYLPLT